MARASDAVGCLRPLSSSAGRTLKRQASTSRLILCFRQRRDEEWDEWDEGDEGADKVQARSTLT
jgi:hypothetical protein